ncbi:hypothetical protein HP467_01900 [Curtobacterium albidum]|uniref:Lipoprotein n=1 Tax=Curtobacterium citreum TaxID=2036 RepID=A0A850DQL5_9MICO|nr:hypothetical protein [Curtobacterium albidum]NUU26868.1 hypothetical protein [Curtobacterium albidum]
MKRQLSIAAGVLAAALVLTGCAGGNADKDAVSKLALKERTMTAGQTEKVAGAWEWKNGWLVLVRVDGKNSTGRYTDWNAYAFAPKGDSWTKTRDELADPADKPESTPHKATCLALAQTDSEVKSCDDLSD